MKLGIAGLVTAEGPLITRLVHNVFSGWSPELSPTDWVLAHEFGHSLGGIHIEGLDCRSPNGLRIPIAHTPNEGVCTWSHYGNQLSCDVMNNAYAHFTAVHKEAFGWLDPSERVVADTGTFELSPLETPGGLKLIRIPFAASSEYGGYALEYRTPVGIDSNVPWHGIPLDGVLLSVYSKWDLTLSFIPRLRVEPASGPIRLSALPLAHRDELGRDVPSYADASRRLALYVRSASASGAVVEIKAYDPNRTGPLCGTVTCLMGQVCCNESCGICAPPNGACPDEICQQGAAE